MSKLRLPVHEVRDGCGGVERLAEEIAISTHKWSCVETDAQAGLRALLFRERRGPLWVMEAAANCARHGQSRFLAQVLRSE